MTLSLALLTVIELAKKQVKTPEDHEALRKIEEMYYSGEYGNG